jgi:ketosteroid isomerase-like protein
VRTSYRGLLAAVFAVVIFATPASLRAAPADDVTAAFNAFVIAQNAHDVDAVKKLLWDSPSFLWITRGTPVVGRDAALARFSSLYGGTWSLAPISSDLRVTMLAPTVASIYVPIDFTIGAAGQPATVTRFLMNQMLVKTDGGWVVAAILPIQQAPPPPPPAPK